MSPTAQKQSPRPAGTVLRAWSCPGCQNITRQYVVDFDVGDSNRNLVDFITLTVISSMKVADCNAQNKGNRLGADNGFRICPRNRHRQTDTGTITLVTFLPSSIERQLEKVKHVQVVFFSFEMPFGCVANREPRCSVALLV